jgi:pimeloyl-ACP methyl ester carboxylesterase
MGAHTLVRFALDQPERAAALVIVTPAYDPDRFADSSFDRWDRLAEGLRRGGVEGFVEAYGDPPVPEQFKDTVRRVLHQRLSSHDHPEAVADALQQVPRSRPFEAWEELGALDMPVVVVASRDEADPEHPYAVAERYAEAIPDARLVSEDPGSSPLAWQGGRLSRVIADAAAQSQAQIPPP